MKVGRNYAILLKKTVKPTFLFIKFGLTEHPSVFLNHGSYGGKMNELMESFEKAVDDLYTIDWSESDGSDVRKVLKTILTTFLRINCRLGI